MVLNQYRDRFRKVIDGPANFCIKLGVSPNQLSFIAFIISILGAISFAFPHIFLNNYHEITPKIYLWWGWIPVLLFGLGSYLDLLDGTVARKTGKVSTFGGFLDSTLDRISDGIIILGLALGKMFWPWEATSWRINTIIGFISLLVIMLISYIRSRAENEGVEMRGIGFMERAERILFLVIAYLIHWVVFCIQTQYFGNTDIENTAIWVFPSLYLIFLILCSHTLLIRFRYVYKILQKPSA